MSDSGTGRSASTWGYCLLAVCAALLVLGGLAAGTATAAARHRRPAPAVRLRGELIPTLARGAARAHLRRAAMAPGEGRQPITLTLVLRRSRQAAFERYLTQVGDPAAPRYHQFLSQRQLARRFGPTQRDYAAVLRWLRAQGFRLTQGSANRLTLTVRASRVTAAHAFGVRLHDYVTPAGRRFYANTSDPLLPARLAPMIEDVSGFSNLGGPARPGAARVGPAARSRAALRSALGSIGHASPLGFNSCTNKLSGGNVECTAFVCGLIFTPPAFFGGNLIETLLNVIIGTIRPLGLFTMTVCGGMYVGMGVSGMTCQGLGRVDPTIWKNNPQCADFAQFGLGPAGVPGRGRTGSGAGIVPAQKIGLLEFDTFKQSDVSDWLSGVGGTAPLAGLSTVSVNGGVSKPGPGESEVLVDIDTVMLFDSLPQTKYVVYDAPASTSFAQMFQAMIAGGDTVISNSWAQCEDQTSLADAQGIDSVLAQAAAAGISVYNGSGDQGSTCLDGSANTVTVPADSPHATAVGGSSATPGPGLTYGTERWWDGTKQTPASGQGGFGISRYFARPTYQDGHTGSAMRSIPDVVANADPAQGMQICQADAGGCPSGGSWGGTSMATPVWAAMTADLNEATGSELGQANSALYPLANSPAFHSAAGMGTDFAHVGLGSFDFERLRQGFGGTSVGAVSSAISIAAGAGPSTTNPYQVPADGSSQGVVQVVLRDANGAPVSGKAVSLTAAGSSAVISGASGPSDADGDVTFKVTDTAVENVILTAVGDGVTLSDRPTLDFVTPSATGASIDGSPSDVVNDGTATATITVYLQDPLGRPAAGKTVSLSQNGSATITPGSSQASTAADGIATFSASDTASEAVSFSAVDVSDGNLPVPGTATINFQPSGPPGCLDTTPTASGGYSVTQFAAGFAVEEQPVVSHRSGVTVTANGCRGSMTAAFDPSGTVYVPDQDTGQIYAFGPGGGSADSGTALPGTTFEPNVLGGIAFGTHGELWATLSTNTNGDTRLVQLDPATGAVQRVVTDITTGATGKGHCPTWVAVDPLSGDVFTGDECGGAYASGVIERVSSPDSTSATVSDYIDVGGTTCGLTFAPDGTLYVAECGNGNVLAVTGTDQGAPTMSTITNVSGGVFGVGVAATGSQGHATALYLTTFAGDVDLIDLTASPATVTTIATGGGRLWSGSVGPDGCFYVGDVRKLLKLGGGGCHPTSPAAQIALTATGASASTGAQVTYTAGLSGFPAAPGTTVTFRIRGPNGQTQLVHADSSGTATFTMTGILTGRDTVTASAANGSATVISAPVRVRWLAGQDVSSLDLNLSQQSGPIGTPATVSATLSDVSQTPAGPIAGAPVTLSLDGKTCTATTSATGVASCSLTPSVTGLLTQTASYGGDGTHTASASSELFEATSPLAGAVPVNTVPPAISGTPGLGAGLSCSPGSWTNAPTGFAYQWNRSGVAIAGATSQAYTVQAADQGQSLSCTVIASNAAGPSAPATSQPVSVPAPPPGSPVNTVLPAITGTPTPGHTPTCSTGSWTNSPTHFSYQWNRDGQPIAGATGASYTVQIIDEARLLACTVTASNATGSGLPATSATVLVAIPGTLTCPKPSGHLNGRGLGPLTLGMTRSRARHKLRRFGVTHNNFDNFCLFAGWGIRVGYPSPKLLSHLSRRMRASVRGRIVLALTANPFYALNHVTPGRRVAAVKRRLHLGKPLHIGTNAWYLTRAGRATGVLKVRGGVIQEVGIADRRLSTGRGAQSRLLRSFSAAHA